MADFGLTLPEHDLTAAEFKELARRLGRAAFTPIFIKLYQRIISSEATIEEQRKVLADIGRWTGVEEDRKVDPNANLPVFNIVFGAPARGRASVEVVDITPPPADPPALPPEDMPAFSSAFRDLAQEVMKQPEAPDAQPSSSASANATEPDVAQVVRALDAADQSLEPAGRGAPDSPGVQLAAVKAPKGRRQPAAVPQAVRVQSAAVAEAPPSVVPQAAKRLTAEEHGVLRAAVADSAEVVAPGRLEDIARSHDSLEESLKGLDSILGI